MTFNSFPYSRPDLEALQTELASLRSSLETAPAYDASCRPCISMTT